MKLSHFGFELPEELLAEYPAEHRDESRLMVLNRKEQTIEHKMFKDVIDYFDEDDVLVLNNTKVFPARLYGNKEKTGARIEVFLLRELNKEQRLAIEDEIFDFVKGLGWKNWNPTLSRKGIKTTMRYRRVPSCAWFVARSMCPGKCWRYDGTVDLDVKDE